jgi:hypothetical protein
MRFSTSSGGTSASTRTRDSGSSVTDVEMVGAAMGGHHDTVAPMLRRLAAWLVTGPLGHLVAGVIDWGVLLLRWLWSRRPSGP